MTPDSPRWCERCQAHGDHHTDRHPAGLLSDHSNKIRPGQVWLCLEHLEEGECSCGLTPYVPRSDLERAETEIDRLQGLVAHDETEVG